MIFVTVGTDGPFDRLIGAVDRWASDAGRRDVFAQIGRSTLQPRHIQYTHFLEPPDFVRRLSTASVIVSHAGMGTILTALRHSKPLIVMPRLAQLGEQRNEHQLATARRLLEMGKITVAFDEAELRERLKNLSEVVAFGRTVGPYAQPELIRAIRGFIHHEPDARAGASEAKAS